MYMSTSVHTQHGIIYHDCFIAPFSVPFSSLCWSMARAHSTADGSLGAREGSYGATDGGGREGTRNGTDSTRTLASPAENDAVRWPEKSKKVVVLC